ncbi:MAG TPA: TraR/DksA C4-type zinc finger protein [Cytophagaceae bacterium]|jgi:hypothetical protein
MICNNCKEEIPELRLKALPHTKTCVQCSASARVAGFPVISGKTTYSELQIVAQDLAEELYHKQNRTGGVAEGVRFKSQPIPKLSNLE